MNEYQNFVVLYLFLPQMLMLLEYHLSMELLHNLQEVENCAMEIADYVGDHGNWYKPILPGNEDCADMMFVPERFDHQGNNWKCLGLGK